MQIPSSEQEIKNLYWTGGPTHHLQKQHVPGYCGHVKGLQAENLYGQPFARLTADTLQDRIERGFIINDQDRLKTTTGVAFSHPKGETVGNDTLRRSALQTLTPIQQQTFS